MQVYHDGYAFLMNGSADILVHTLRTMIKLI